MFRSEPYATTTNRMKPQKPKNLKTVDFNSELKNPSRTPVNMGSKFLMQSNKSKKIKLTNSISNAKSMNIKGNMPKMRKVLSTLRENHKYIKEHPYNQNYNGRFNTLMSPNKKGAEYERFNKNATTDS